MKLGISEEGRSFTHLISWLSFVISPQMSCDLACALHCWIWGMRCLGVWQTLQPTRAKISTDDSLKMQSDKRNRIVGQLAPRFRSCSVSRVAQPPGETLLKVSNAFWHQLLISSPVLSAVPQCFQRAESCLFYVMTVLLYQGTRSWFFLFSSSGPFFCRTDISSTVKKMTWSWFEWFVSPKTSSLLSFRVWMEM